MHRYQGNRHIPNQISANFRKPRSSFLRWCFLSKAGCLFPNTTIAMVCIKCIVLHPPKHQPVLTLHDKYSYRCWSPLTFIEHIGAVKFQLLSRCIWISKWQIFRPRTFSNNCIDLKFFHMSRLWHHTQRKSSSGKKASKVIKYLYTFWHHVFLSLFLA